MKVFKTLPPIAPEIEASARLRDSTLILPCQAPTALSTRPSNEKASARTQPMNTSSLRQELQRHRLFEVEVAVGLAHAGHEGIARKPYITDENDTRALVSRPRTFRERRSGDRKYMGARNQSGGNSPKLRLQNTNVARIRQERGPQRTAGLDLSFAEVHTVSLQPPSISRKHIQ